MKTNAARLLDTLGAAYELREYDPGEELCWLCPIRRRVVAEMGPTGTGMGPGATVR